MDKSILNTIKKMLGIDSEEIAFDTDIIVLINQAFMVLRQLGVGPTAGFLISDENSIWSDFTSATRLLGSIQTYIYMKVRVAFDPPTGSTLSAYQSMISEIEWRLNVDVDPNDTFSSENDDSSGSSGDDDSDGCGCECRDYTTDSSTAQLISEIFDS